VVLWRNYLAYHMQRNEIEQAKRVFYRAIRVAPHSKVLWLECANLNMSAKEMTGMNHNTTRQTAACT
jgi:predicted Zn-dependent protease